MDKLNELDREVAPLIAFLKTISNTINILGPINAKLFSADALRALKKGDRRITLNLIERGVPSRDVRMMVFGLSQLSDIQISQISMLLEKGVSQRELNIMLDSLESIRSDKNKIQIFVDREDYNKALIVTISIKEKLRDLRTKYNLNTERAEKITLDLQKVWG